MGSKLVVLIYPKLERYKLYQYPPPPLSLLTLASYLEAKGYEVKIIDGRQESYKKALKEIDSVPICFGISCILSYQIQDGLNISKLIKERFPQTPLIWGGWFPTVLPDLTASDPNVDVVITGQGEVTLADVVENLSKGGDFSLIQGICFKQEGKIIANGERTPEDPNNFPLPAYHLLNTSRYSIFKGSINYVSSFGCPYDCQFCEIQRVFKRKWLELNGDRVVGDLELLVSQFGIKEVDFVDDNFFASKKRVIDIMEGIIKKGLQINWFANGRIDQLIGFKRDVLELMKRSGCKTVTVGAESGKQEILDSMHKGITVEDTYKINEMFKNCGINLRMNFLYGLPEELPEDFRKTLGLIENLKRLNHDLLVTMYFYVPIPGTPYYIRDKRADMLREPKVLAEWGGYIQTDVTRPWHFESDTRILKDRRKMYRIMAFYFLMAHFGKQISLFKKKSFTQLLSLFQKISSFRIEYGFFILPIEWHIARYLYKLINRVKRYLIYDG